MPKILVDNTKNIKERTYAIKTCPICGSVIEISEREAMNTPNNEEGFMEFECPCGQKLPIYKYFGGKKYNDKEYKDCLDYFKEKVNNIINDFKDCSVGYGLYYFCLNHTELVVSPIHIKLDAYIDRYEFENWEKCIVKNELYRSYDICLPELSNDLDKCALYAQALSDYILYSFDKTCKQGVYDLHLESVDKNKLIAYFRNADTNFSEEDMIMMRSQKYEFG